MVDNIDLEATTEHGFIVVNAPDGNINATAEHTMALHMSLVRIFLRHRHGFGIAHHISVLN